MKPIALFPCALAFASAFAFASFADTHGQTGGPILGENPSDSIILQCAEGFERVALGDELSFTCATTIACPHPPDLVGEQGGPVTTAGERQRIDSRWVVRLSYECVWNVVK